MDPQVLEAIYSAIDEVNAGSADGVVIAKTPDTVLMGDESALDSLAFVNLIVALESEIETRFGESLVLVNEKTLESGEHPFRTVETLAVLVSKLLHE
jgi:acyl carrier protein